MVVTKDLPHGPGRNIPMFIVVECEDHSAIQAPLNTKRVSNWIDSCFNIKSYNMLLLQSGMNFHEKFFLKRVMPKFKAEEKIIFCSAYHLLLTNKLILSIKNVTKLSDIKTMRETTLT